MRGRAALWLLLITLAGVLRAQQAPADQACVPFTRLEVPEADKPTLAQAASARAPCSSFDLYYGSYEPGRFTKARWCALATLGMLHGGVDPERTRTVQSAATGGATDPELDEADGLTLLMLYANGEGVVRNRKVAQTLACQYAFDSPQAASNQMPALLHSLGSGQSFRLCGEDQGPQGRSVWYACAMLQAGKTVREANSREAAILIASSPPERSAWRAVEKAWADLSSARVESFGAQCSGGTGCGVMSAQDNLHMEQSWLAKLKVIHSRELPSGLPDATEFKSLDIALNQVYRDQITEANVYPAADVQDASSDLARKERTTERAWIQFRDAWVSYAALHWPRVPADRWRAWLTAEWTGTLQAN